MDAPERDQPHGQAAKKALSALVYGKSVGVEPIEQDRYDRLVARLWLGDLDVNAELVKQGAAWVYRLYSDDAAYCAYEGRATSAAGCGRCRASSAPHPGNGGAADPRRPLYRLLRRVGGRVRREPRPLS